MLNILKKFQKIESLPPRLKNLYNHYILRNIGFGLISIFGPIFLYQVSGKNINFVIYVFLFTSLGYAFTLPFFAKLLKHFSMHIFLIFGTFFASIYLYFLYALSEANQIILLLVGGVIVFDILNKLFYWVPYNVDFARFIDKHHRGRRISFLWIIISLTSMILPVFSGFVVERFGFNVLFVIAIFILLISILPAFFITHTRESFSFNYFETFQKLFSKKHFKTNLAYAADGWQKGIGFFIWPVFIFMILNGKYLEIGILSGIIVLSTCILRFFVGEATDKFDKKKMIKTGSFLYALGWIFKALSSTALHVFLAGTYHDFVMIFLKTPFDATTYEIAADQGHYVDEFSVVREISIHFGRSLMFLLALLLLNYFSIIWIFIIGGIISLFLNLITKEEFVY